MSARMVTFRLLQGLLRFPGTLLLLCLALLAVSLVAIRSASLTPDGTFAPFLIRQVVWTGAGLCGFLAAAFIPYERVTRRAFLFYGLGLLALACVFAVGTRVNGSLRWFSLGPIRVQPSEFMKYGLVLVLARAVAQQGDGIRTWGGLAKAGVITAIPCALVMAQPDLGTTLTYLPIAFAIVLAAGARGTHLLSLVGAGLATIPVAWLFVLRDYQKMRVLAFLDSSEHALGGAYQTLQSVIAVGSGGLWGRGYMQGTQGPLGFLPERHTDFIFGVICEDFGLVGGLAVLALYAALLLTLAGIAKEARDVEGRLIAVGVATITCVQVGVNVGMALGVMPVTGLTLPLVSYGGSSLVAAMLGFGLAASVARSRRLVFA